MKVIVSCLEKFEIWSSGDFTALRIYRWLQMNVAAAKQKGRRIEMRTNQRDRYIVCSSLQSKRKSIEGRAQVRRTCRDGAVQCTCIYIQNIKYTKYTKFAKIRNSQNLNYGMYINNKLKV